MEGARNTFEQDWQQSFADAEVTPPSHVWAAIDRELANDEVIVYKREAQFYRWIAAACFLILSIGGVFYWFGGNLSNESTIAFKETKFEIAPNEENSVDVKNKLEGDEPDQLNANKVQNLNQKEVVIESESSGSQLLTSDTYVSNSVLPSDIDKSKKATLANLTPKSTTFNSQLSPWQADQLYGVARTWGVEKTKKESGPMWAGLSLSTGSFDPGFGRGSNNDMAFATHEDFLAESATVARQPNSPAYSSGQSIAGGFNLGKKITDRFQLSSGLHYSAFNTGSASSQVVADAENNAYALTSDTSDEMLINELDAGNLSCAGEQVQLANEYQYLTIPLKAGYVVLDKKFNITLNTGLSGNVLVNSNLKAENSSEELNNDFSTSNQYQNVYFNLLTSVEFGYVIKEHYQLSVEPNYNQALTEFTNANHSNQAKPRYVGVSIGFRYNF